MNWSRQLLSLIVSDISHTQNPFLLVEHMHLHDLSVCLRALAVFFVAVAFRRCVFKAVMSIMNLNFLRSDVSL